MGLSNRPTSGCFEHLNYQLPINDAEKIKIEEAVSLKLAHDITRIISGKFKRAAFGRGRVVG